jgi:hypothetical protein
MSSADDDARRRRLELLDRFKTKYNHLILSPATVQEYEDAFNCTIKTAHYPRSLHNDPESVDGPYFEGLSAHALAMALCSAFKIKYAFKHGIGSQLWECWSRFYHHFSVILPAVELVKKLKPLSVAIPAVKKLGFTTLRLDVDEEESRASVWSWFSSHGCWIGVDASHLTDVERLYFVHRGTKMPPLLAVRMRPQPSGLDNPRRLQDGMEYKPDSVTVYVLTKETQAPEAYCAVLEEVFLEAFPAARHWVGPAK